jgi:hypothetical protein
VSRGAVQRYAVRHRFHSALSAHSNVCAAHDFRRITPHYASAAPLPLRARTHISRPRLALNQHPQAALTSKQRLDRELDSVLCIAP